MFFETEYIELAPGYVKEVLEVYDAWDQKENAPSRVKELMMVLRIELSRRYDPGAGQKPEPAKIPVYRDMRLG